MFLSIVGWSGLTTNTTDYEDVFDTNANEYLVSPDADIIRSEITITDSQGRNKTLVRAQQR